MVKDNSGFLRHDDFVWESVSNKISEMINLLCQIDWATVNRYLVKHHGRCFGEGILDVIYT